MSSLANLNTGDSGEVEQICIGGRLRHRLRDIGLIEGTNVKCVLKSPFGDPAAYIIRGALIALRSEDAGMIKIKVRGNN